MKLQKSQQVVNLATDNTADQPVLFVYITIIITIIIENAESHVTHLTNAGRILDDLDTHVQPTTRSSRSYVGASE